MGLKTARFTDKKTRIERKQADQKQVAKPVKQKVCYNCRQEGHRLVHCPSLAAYSEENLKGIGTLATGLQITGICFHCGSTDHKIYRCPKPEKDFAFAHCFICSQNGHLARQCPRNSNGVYPHGGACHLCQDKGHRYYDCTLLKKNKGVTEVDFKAHAFTRESITVGVESEDFGVVKKEKVVKKRPRLYKI